MLARLLSSTDWLQLDTGRATARYWQGYNQIRAGLRCQASHAWQSYSQLLAGLRCQTSEVHLSYSQILAGLRGPHSPSPAELQPDSELLAAIDWQGSCVHRRAWQGCWQGGGRLTAAPSYWGSNECWHCST